MWKFWLVGFLVIGTAFALDLVYGVLHVYRGGLTVFCAVMLVVTWRKSHPGDDEASKEVTDD